VSDPVLRVSAGVFDYGSHRALDEVDLSVGMGERIAILGPSGSGKSTLLALLTGALTPTSGTVQAFGEDLALVGTRRRRDLTSRIGALRQDLDLIDSVRVLHNVNVGRLGRWPLHRSLFALVTSRADADTRRVLDQVGLPWAMYARASELSGGERQRVAIARLLIQGAEVVVADEPVSSLDPTTARDVLDLICASARTGSVVVSLHQPRLARRSFTRAIGIRDGAVSFDLPADEVTESLLETLYLRA